MINSSNTEKEQRSHVKTSALSPPTISYSKWSGRFTWTAIVQSAAAAMLTTMLAAFSWGIEYPLKLVKIMLPQSAIGFSALMLQENLRV